MLSQLVKSVCLAESKIIPRNAEDYHFENIIYALLNRGNPAKVGVMFANEDNCRRFVKALVRLNRTQDLKLLASDSWGAKIHPVYGQEEAAVGTITMLVKRKDIKEFDDYFLNLTLNNNQRNPWFPDFWETTFDCSIKGNREKRRCTGNESLREVSGYKQEGLVQFVMDAVHALANAVHDSLADHCPNGFSRCPHLRNITGERFLSYIRNVSFTGIAGDRVMFNANGDGLGRYDIYQYQRTGKGTFQYSRVGEWIDSSLQWKNGSGGLPPSSICSQPCKLGESRKRTSQCCWICAPCKDNQYLQDESTCVSCSYLSKPDGNRTGCVRLPEIYLDFSSLWFLIPAAFCVCGVVTTGFVVAVFIRFNNTPMIMASGRELCYILLLGIFLAYATALLMLMTPSPALCAFIRLGVGVSLCFIYAGLLTKTNRIYRIFNVGIKAMVKRPSYTSPRSQILICTCLVSVQVVGGLTWLGFEKPATEYRLHNKDFLAKECRASQVATMISLFYNMFLIVLCTVYAFKTRNIPQNFNEAKYIAFAMYSTCIVWSAFIPIYFGANHDFRIEVTSLCMCVAISSTVSLFCLFAPKVYIVVFHPHKNVRQPTNPTSFMSSSSKTARSFYGCSASIAFPVVNGSCSLRPNAEEERCSLRETAVDNKVEVLNAFHDSMEDLSCGDMPSPAASHDDLKLSTNLDNSSVRFIDQSPDSPRNSSLGMPASGESANNFTDASSPFFQHPPGDIDACSDVSSPSIPAPPRGEIDASSSSEVSSPYVRHPTRVDHIELPMEYMIEANEQMSLSELLMPKKSTDTHDDVRLTEPPDQLPDRQSLPYSSMMGLTQERPGAGRAADSLARMEASSRVSDSNLNRRSGHPLYSLREKTGFGSCDNNSFFKGDG
ncbi:hypothetical protein ACOMHN_059783 [Nucella lapillus]